MAFQVEQIDHVEIFVSDRHQAAKWYKDVLGLSILRDYQDWAVPSGGPLMISSDAGQTKLALFQGEPKRQANACGISRIAFKVSGDAFLQFLQHLEDKEVYNSSHMRLSPDDCVDHDKAYSVYFCDPDGNNLEVTTYDHRIVSERLSSQVG